jgi:hypothetical protein
MRGSNHGFVESLESSIYIYVLLTGYNLTIVRGKGNTRNALFVSDKATSGLSGGNVPQTKFGIPRGTQGKGTIAGNDNITDEV